MGNSFADLVSAPPPGVVMTSTIEKLGLGATGFWITVIFAQGVWPMPLMNVNVKMLVVADEDAKATTISPGTKPGTPAQSALIAV